MLSVRVLRWRRLAMLFGVIGLITIAVVAIVAPRPESASANPLTNITAISAGEFHTCAVVDGAAMCWGLNTHGQVGDSTTADRNVPAPVSGLGSGIIAISAGGQHSCALTAAGGVKCWGENSTGQLGDSTTTQRNTPVDVVGLSTGVTAVAAGWSHTCAALTAGGVMCWGANGFGQLGDGTTTPSTVPVSVAGLPVAVAGIATSVFHTCVRTSAGAALCWGNNESGQLGNGSSTNSSSPVGVSGLASGVAEISAGSAGTTRSTCALTSAGSVKCWGNNQFGQLGAPSGNICGVPCSLTPIGVSGLSSGVATIAVGGHNACAGLDSGGVQCWGSTYGSAPDDVPGLSGAVTQLSRGADHGCALVASGTGARCWGHNGKGQLGIGTFISTNDAVEVIELVVKPTPTPTPCPVSGCPTPTPPSPCAADTCLALAIKDGSGSVACHSTFSSKCEVRTGEAFTLVVDATKIPAAGYILVQTFIEFDPLLTYLPKQTASDEMAPWPDLVFAVRSFDTDSVLIGGQTSIVPPRLISTHVGPVIELDFMCSATESTTDIVQLPYLDPRAFTSGALYTDADNILITPPVGSLTINCVNVSPAAELRGIAAQDGRAPWLLAALGLGAIAGMSALAVARRQRAASR